MYFAYGETELSYLRQKDKRLGAVIDRVGHVQRAVDTDLFSSVVHCGCDPGSERAEGHRRLDGGDDPAVLSAAPRYFQL